MEDYDSLSKAQKDRINAKGFWFNGSTHKLDDIDNIKKNIIAFPFYAYIMHKPDSDDDSMHIHFLLCIRGTLKVRKIAESLYCSYGDVQKTSNANIYARYMLHIGFDDKDDKYDVKDVITNDFDRFTYLLGGLKPQVNDIYADFCSLKSGRISRVDFIDKYKGELSCMNFYQKIRTFGEIERIAKY